MGYLKVINEKKYLILAPSSESKVKIKKYEELWIIVKSEI